MLAAARAAWADGSVALSSRSGTNCFGDFLLIVSGAHDSGEEQWRQNLQVGWEGCSARRSCPSDRRRRAIPITRYRFCQAHPPVPRLVDLPVNDSFPGRHPDCRFPAAMPGPAPAVSNITKIGVLGHEGIAMSG
jgi:hypothetical protein